MIYCKRQIYSEWFRSPPPFFFFVFLVNQVQFSAVLWGRGGSWEHTLRAGHSSRDRSNRATHTNMQEVCLSLSRLSFFKLSSPTGLRKETKEAWQETQSGTPTEFGPGHESGSGLLTLLDICRKRRPLSCLPDG